MMSKKRCRWVSEKDNGHGGTSQHLRHNAPAKPLLWSSMTDRVIHRPRTRHPRGPLHVDQEGTITLPIPSQKSPKDVMTSLPIDANLIFILQAVAVRKHLERNRKDKDSKFRLILIESRIHRLSRYYKTVGVLPPTWRYESATASTMVA